MDHVTSRPLVPEADRNAWTEPGVEDLGGGVYRIPLPLPGDALKAVNIYAIASDEGVYLVDAGMAIAQAREELTGALGKLGYGLGDIRNFFITHIHQDHYTLAVELRTTLRGEILLGEGERDNLRLIQEVAAGKREPGFIEVLTVAGAADLQATVRKLFGGQGHGLPEMTMPWSAPDRWLADGAELRLPSRSLRAIHTPGHTQGHVVYHDEANLALFAGDHVLPHITPSIGFQPAVTRTALADYMNSLRRVLELPDSRLLPAHGPVCGSTHARVDQLLEHHEERLARTLATTTGGAATAYQAAQSIPWTRRQRKFADLDPISQMLATGETAAHLEVLVARGQLARHTSGDGVDTYAPAPAAGD